jgi:hypothetical protein
LPCGRACLPAAPDAAQAGARGVDRRRLHQATRAGQNACYNKEEFVNHNSSGENHNGELGLRAVVFVVLICTLACAALAALAQLDFIHVEQTV